MVQSKAATVAEYLKSLPEDRRQTISTVRDVIKKNLPAGYQETMNWGMISYEIPLSTYPDTYNGQPLSFAALASQKNHCGLYLMCCYQDAKLRATLEEAFEKLGKKPDLGKSCIRFRTADDLPLKEIGKIISGTSVQKFIKIYEESRKK